MCNPCHSHTTYKGTCVNCYYGLLGCCQGKEIVESYLSGHSFCQCYGFWHFLGRFAILLRCVKVRTSPTLI